MYDDAVSHYRAGRLTEAAESCRAMLNLGPRDFRVLHLLGRVRHAQGMLDEAAFFLTAALGTAPQGALAPMAALNELGTVLLAQQNPEAAIDCHQRALALHDDDAPSWFNLGNALYAAGRFEDAVAAYRRASDIAPDSAETYNNLGNALRHTGNPALAVEAFQHAIALRPGLAAAHNNLGRTFAQLNRPAEAAASHRQALALVDDAEARLGLAAALCTLNEYAEAEQHSRHAAALLPDDPAALAGLGNALLGQLRQAEALEYYERAAALEPRLGTAWLGSGAALAGLNRHAEALDRYGQAATCLTGSAELDFNQALTLLTLGDFAPGWRLFEARFDLLRWRLRSPDPVGDPQWRGEQNIAGKTIMLQAEQGLGDTIQFVRYVPMVAALGARVVLAVQPELKRLMSTMPGATQVIAPGDPVPEVDLRCPLMSLPLAFRTDLASLPADIPYLHADPALIAAWHARLGPRRIPRIGIAWSGASIFRNDLHRSLPLDRLGPLLRVPGYEFHMVQKDVRPDDAATLGDFTNLRDHSAALTDFAETAALMSHMDLVISVDTSLAHLAGALGRPVWIMLAFSPDWRWLQEREDSPWYPTANLFRQRAARDWDELIQRVTARLEEHRLPLSAPAAARTLRPRTTEEPP